MLLKKLVNAGIPLVVVHTADSMNAKMMLEYIFKPKKIKKLTDHLQVKKDSKEECVYYMEGDLDPNAVKKVYETMVEVDSTLIIINPKKDLPEARDGGGLTAPESLIKHILKEALGDGSENLMPALKGLSVKDVGEVIRLASTSEEGLNQTGIVNARKLLVSTSQGLELVDTTLPYYFPETQIEEYASKEKEFFLGPDIDHRLVPRGLMMDGPPGTGKSQGAKYLALQWNVPLFKLDGTVQSKWVGESEANLRRALALIDAQAPCILLLDEVEKLVTYKQGSDSTGVGAKMLQQLLWWLQEHRTKVFTVMTSNARDRLPPELYRPGRIDKVMVFGLLSEENSKKFVAGLVTTFEKADSPKYKAIVDDALKLMDESKTPETKDEKEFSPATLTEYVHAAVKKNFATKVVKPTVAESTETKEGK